MITKNRARRWKFTQIVMALILLAGMVVLPAARTEATAPIEGNTTEFADSGQTLGSATSLSVALGDVDGDGDLDAFVVNLGQGAGEANTVWTNDGSGLFSDSGQALGSARSTGVALGDVDGDGDLDAFVANFGADTVWTNDGSGVFSDSGQALGSVFSTGVALGDVDGDGDLDAFVATYSIDFYGVGNKVWTNDGSGLFSDSGQALGSAVSLDVALGDVDGDGDLDAFVANAGEQGAGEANTVWTNDGSGLFSDSGQALGSARSNGVALGDVDGDGDLDAFVANTGLTAGEANTVWTNDGNGLFSDSGQALGSADSADVALGDVDGDGDLDAFVANRGSGAGEANKVWTNDGSGLFSDSGQALGSAYSNDVALGDVDGDGDLDAFAANSGANTVWINVLPHRNAPFADSGQALGSAYSNGVTLGDVDGDGDLDAFVANGRNEGNTVWTNDGSGLFSDSGQVLGSGDSGGVALGDVDGDGDLDAFVFGFGANTVWTNDGSGLFSNSGQALGSAVSTGVALGDLDGDGDLDAFVANLGFGGDPANRVWTNNGSGLFSDSGQALGSADSTDVALGDVDGDGDLDAFVANFGQGVGVANTVWTNDGSGVFSDSGQALGSGISNGVALGDVDGDGDLDAFVANLGFGGDPANRVWTNNGSGLFSDSGQALGSADSADVALGDMDGDGDLDAFVANFGQGGGPANKVWINDGSGLFSDSGQALGSAYSVDVALGDVDGDGDLDAFVANTGLTAGDANKVWTNTGGSAGVAVTVPGSPIQPGMEGNVLKIVLTHNGISGDRDLELARWDLDIFSDGSSCSVALDTATANSLLAKLRVRLDDGDGVFESDGSDVQVAEIDTFALTGGVQAIPFTNDDTNVQVSGTNSKTYWVSLLTNSTQGNLCFQLDPDADMVIEGKTPDFSVSIQDTSPTTAVVQTGGTSEIEVTGLGQTIASGDTSPTTSDDTDFGSVAVGSPVAHTFTVSNTGNVDLTLSGASLATASAFTLTQPVSSTVGSGQATTFTVTFNPTAAGSFTDTVSIASNDSDENPYTFVVGGTGTLPVTILSTNPVTNAVGVAVGQTITASFSADVDGTTVTTRTFAVRSSFRGLYTETATVSGSTVSLNPERDFFAGEQVQVVGTGDIRGNGGAALSPTQWGFTAGPVTNRCLAGFTDISAGLTGIFSGSVAWGDYDNDGDLDILFTGDDGSNVMSKVYRNDSGSFTDIGTGLTGVRNSSVAWGDYDNDGDLDILLTGRDASINPESKVYRNDSGSFTAISAGLTGVYRSSVAWGDYDNDGDLDILLTGVDGSKVVSKVYRNDSGSFTDIGAGLTGVAASSVVWGDYDNDGDLDILLTGVDGSNAVSKVYRNDSGSFTAIGAGLTGVRFGSVAWGDYDNDGDLDILLTGLDASGNPVSKVYRNDRGSFTAIGAGLTGVATSSVAWGDYDNDGDLDILLTGDDASSPVSKVYRNDSGNFTAIGAGLTGVGNSSVTWGDYDNDGDLDILLTGYDGSSPVSKVYRNDDCAPEIEVTGLGQTISNGDTSPTSADDTDFGSITDGDPAVTHTFTVSNTGNVDLTLSGASLATASAFTLTQPVSSTVGSGQATTFTVTFNPTAAGSFTDTVSIASNDSDENPYTFVVSGTASLNSADLSIVKTVETQGTFAVTYTLTVSNLGPGAANGAVVSDTLPATVSGASWTCEASNGAVCPNASGTGNLLETVVTFPASGIVNYTISGSLNNWGSFSNTAQVSPPAGVIDPNLDNNQATITRYMLLLLMVFNDADLR